jgi:acyl-coenzyme A synthetase/AMP-(fatty) acid ligase
MRLASSSLRATLRTSERLGKRRLWAARRALKLADIAGNTVFGSRLRALAGRSVLIRTTSTLAAATALVELDGLARRMVICPPDLKDEDLPDVVATAGIDAVAFDEPTPAIEALGLPLAPLGPSFEPLDELPVSESPTEWVMFTSGTTGAPKMVVHTLDGLVGAIKAPIPGSAPLTWGTFYDIRRYGGLQILLRGLLGEGSMVLTEPDEPLSDLLGRLGRHGVTHLTGTPSQWRRVLMNHASSAIVPAYVRLSGEIADQAVLDALKARFPEAAIGHAYASTEAGVGFEVNDGLEGFPASFVDVTGEVEMRVVDGTLRLRSGRTARSYVNSDAPALMDAEGFVDSRDMVELSGDRFHFVGRRDGVINVGGLKVCPEEIEAVINRHPAVRAALVKGRRNPITGEIVVAEVMLVSAVGAATDEAALKAEILSACRRDLAPHKVPAGLRFVPALAMTASGKLERAGA